MATVTSSWLFDAFLLVLSLILALYAFFLFQFQYWKRLKIPYAKPVFLFGNIKGAIVSKPMGEIIRSIYFQHKSNPYVGMWNLHTPVLLVRDPDLVKTIFVKEFATFQDRGVYYNEKDDPLTAHLFAIGGTKWRKLRTKLTPTFTSGKMKMMFPLVAQCGKQLATILKEPAERGEILEMKDIAARFTTDVISLCAFGLEANSLNDPNSEFRQTGRKVFEPNIRNGLARFLSFFMPNIARLINLVILPKEVSEFFLKAVRDTMDYRKKNNVKRNDFMQLLIQLKDTGKLEDTDEKEDTKADQKFTFLEAAAQAFIFFGAGFETSSTTMQFTLYELSLNPDIQERAREEILRVLAKYNGELTYEGIYEMNYLGQVIDETLRKYPALPTLQREAARDFRFPDTDHVIPKGTQVYISIWSMHMDPTYFPNPEKYDPDRFTTEEKAKRHHYVYMPFGEGPRNCIGMRFGLMQTRVGLIQLLSNYRFEVCPETTIPLVFDKRSFVVAPKYGMRLKITALKR